MKALRTSTRSLEHRQCPLLEAHRSYKTIPGTNNNIVDDLGLWP